MSKKASTHGASAPSKSKTARSKTAKAKSKDKAAPRKEVRKAASEAASKHTAAAAKQGGSPRRSRSKSLFDSSSDEAEEEGAVTEPQEISNDLDEQQERYQAAQLQGAPAPPTPVYPRGYYPPDAGSGSPMFLEHLKAPCGLHHGRTSPGAYERALVQDEPLFVNDIEAARCVLLAPYRIPLTEFTKDRGGLFPVWGYPWVQPENTTNETHTENLFWRWVSLKNFTVQELKELREDCLLSYVLDQRDIRIDLSPALKTSAGTVPSTPGTAHRKATKKPRTTYAPAVDPKSQQPSGSQPGAGLPAPTSSVTRGNPATSLAAGASQSAAALGRPAPHGSGALRSDQEGQKELSHAFEYEAPSLPHPSGRSTSGRDSVGSLLSDEVLQLRDRVYAIEIALGIGPGGQAASQAGKPGDVEVLRQDISWPSSVREEGPSES
ncbi:ATP-binding cassette (ABC) Superfamily [Phytophthora palmivora]|uniref:ATP-binding cassette (ABC) Superfamily n=1 Tax=Phytophthora palmivora TaxID=4796 RepID=A0A2P4XFY2_9STRA|nr:ATP-binding cassette (ABC) Superfamily [Phytophthora palmivora]